MKKILLSLITVLFPALVFAEESALSFTPPTTDVSVSFLGNVFGVVDGVLHGSGSQMMGSMFGVFNAAVLALGGIIIMYTLIVSTVNTAHEGEMLGKKWSSIWVPVRSTLGLSLLIPKASGYCLMQILFMWIVVQGVGAADKIWNAALNYLERGGVIVQQQIKPISAIMGDGLPVANGAAKILYGQVCMLGIQTLLTNQRQAFLNQQNSGPCKQNATGEPMKTFCDKVVPNFLDSVKIQDVQEEQDKAADEKFKKDTAIYEQKKAQGDKTAVAPVRTQGSYSVNMPNLTEAQYSDLNGICGTINWLGLELTGQLDKLNSSLAGADKNVLSTAKLSRAIAIQQIYVDLSIIAQVIINNNPDLSKEVSFNSNTSGSSGQQAPTPEQLKAKAQEAQNQAAQQQQKTNASSTPSFAKEDFGIPMTSSNTPCETGKPGSNQCTAWGSAKGDTSPLFNGTEFQGALTDYNAIMLPTLNLIDKFSNDDNFTKQREFLDQARSSGWMLAGAYFFDLARLSSANVSNTSDSDALLDLKGGLEKSTFNLKCMLAPFAGGAPCNGRTFSNLGVWLKNDKTRVDIIQTMFSNNAGATEPDIPSGFSQNTFKLVPGDNASTVFGFVNNSMMMTLAGQQGATAPTFSLDVSTNFEIKGINLPEESFPCGGVDLGLLGEWCIGRWFGEIFYNMLIRYVIQIFIGIILTAINTIAMAFLALPLLGMGLIFQKGVSYIQDPDANPIIALANMGISYINFASDLWMYLLVIAVGAFLMGPFGGFIFALLGMALPLLMAWLTVMVSIGFVTAYYVPFVPYMIFTFGAIGWLMAVVEAMVAAPIVALGITHPEGEGAFGKGEHAVMILMNVFLRPSLMIIGYIAGIILSFVGVWVINAGFTHVIPFMQAGTSADWAERQAAGLRESYGSKLYTGKSADNKNYYRTMQQGAENSLEERGDNNQLTSQEELDTYRAIKQANKKYKEPSTNVVNYTGWAGIYAFFFSILLYTTLYMTVIQKAFSLITSLPDKVLRWIGGQPEQIGQETAGWTEEPKKQLEAGGKGTEKGGAQVGKEVSGQAMKAFHAQQDAGDMSVEATKGKQK